MGAPEFSVSFDAENGNGEGTLNRYFPHGDLAVSLTVQSMHDVGLFVYLFVLSNFLFLFCFSNIFGSG